MNPLERRVVTMARDANMFPEQGTVLLAVSGGPDSVALLDLMVHGGVASALDLDVAVVHVDHGIHPNSGAIAGAVADLAKSHAVPARQVVLQLGQGTSETKARRARYRAMRRVQQELGARYLATAHHRDDQVETVLFRMLRGSGPAGLAGIAARGRQGLVRPLLHCSRAELATHLMDRGVTPPCISDPANASMQHDRSWLRQELLPRLRARFGVKLDHWLEGAARHAADDRTAWRQLVRTLPELEFRSDVDFVEVARGPLATYDKALSEAILRALTRETGLVVGRRRCARLRNFSAGARSGRRLELGQGFEAEINFDRLLIRRVPAALRPPAAEMDLTREGTLSWGGWDFRWSPDKAEKLARVGRVTWMRAGSVRVRGPRPGDRVLPLEGVGHRRVRRMLSEARVPSRDRDRYPIVESGGVIVWVPGVCRGSDAVPSEGETAVKIEARDRDRTHGSRD